MFENRSDRLERIDTGDYTPEEYRRFLREIRFVNRYVGDNRALRKTLLKEIGFPGRRIRILDVGAGSGELLRTIADHVGGAAELELVGLDSNSLSADSIITESEDYKSIKAVQGDAMNLPFQNDTFDYVISSLFTHHLTTDQIASALSEMKRVSISGVFVIDLHRHPVAYILYRVMCVVFGISELVTHDGSLSILKGFKPDEFLELGAKAGFESSAVTRSFPFRLVLSGGEGLPGSRK